MAARLLSQVGANRKVLYGGGQSNGMRNKLIRKSGKQHVTSFYRRFKLNGFYIFVIRQKHDVQGLTIEKSTFASKDAFSEDKSCFECFLPILLSF